MHTKRVSLIDDPRLLWGSFGIGFLWPPLFLLTLALALRAARRCFVQEYGEVFHHWKGYLRRGETPIPNADAAAGRRVLLKPATEMV